MTNTRPVDVDPVTAAVNAAVGQVAPARIGVACSGGADSMALAHAAIAAAGAARVVVITIDHGLSAGSASVAAAVATWAMEQGAATAIRRVVVEDRASIEAAARDARYAAFAEVALEQSLAVLLVGHTARDQAETVLMRVVRGTGPAGLAGIPAQRSLDGTTIVRPLLAVTRDAIDAYIARHELPTWSDPMNADPQLFRVRVRDQILPALRRENPQVDAALVRLATTATEWLAAIDTIAAPLATLPIACAALATQPPAIRKRAVAIALERHAIDYDARHLDAIDELVLRPSAGQVALDLPAARIVRSYDALDLERRVGIGDTIRAPDGYQLRVWQPGDRMRPARLRGHSRKLSDLFIDAKVSRDLRGGARVLVRLHDGVIVWAEHLGLAHGEAENLVPRPPE